MSLPSRFAGIQQNCALCYTRAVDGGIRVLREEMDEPTGPYHILVVDSEPSNIEIVTHRLVQHGYRVSSRDSARAAYELIDAERPDLVLLDLILSEVSGLDVLDRLRADPSTSNLPIILVSALAGTEDVVRGLQAGANDYVTKPIDMPVLLARIETHIKGAAMLRTSERRAELLRKLAQVDDELIRTMQQKALLIDPDAVEESAPRTENIWEREPTVDVAPIPLPEGTDAVANEGDDNGCCAGGRTESTLFELLEAEMSRCKSANSALSLLVWEARQINELTARHGRSVCVELIGKLVDRVAAILEPGAVLCAYQSPAFCVVIGGASLSRAAYVAERVEEAVTAAPFNTEIGSVALSCNVGIASYLSSHGSSPQDVVDRAVCALEQARNSERSPIWIARASGLLTPHDKH